MVVSQGTYYAFTTAGQFGPIQLFTSNDLSQWAVVTPSPLVHEPAWAWPGQEWAPVVSEFGSTWIMYYSTFDIATQTHCISIATSAAVSGPYVDDSTGPLVCQPGYGGNLDPDVLTAAAGAPYLVWSTEAGVYSSLAEVWSQPLAADGQSFVAGSSPTVLIRQDQAWESTVENPDMVLVDGQYYLFYSGGYWGSADYSVGYAVCAGPQGPCAKPLDHPILVSSATVSGPGGEFAFRDTTGQWWMAYAAWTAGQVGYPGGARSLRIDPLCFVDGGQGGPADPVVLGPTSTPQPLHQSCPSADQGDGYRLVTPAGSVYPFGDVSDFGAPVAPASPIVGVTTDPATGGYWELGSDGRVYPFGAPFFGDLGGSPWPDPSVGMVATPDGGGYWMVAADGGVFAFGDARLLRLDGRRSR